MLGPNTKSEHYSGKGKTDIATKHKNLGGEMVDETTENLPDKKSGMLREVK